MAAGKGIVAELRRASCGWFVNISAFGNSLPRLYGLTSGPVLSAACKNCTPCTPLGRNSEPALQCCHVCKPRLPVNSLQALVFPLWILNVTMRKLSNLHRLRLNKASTHIPEH